MVPADIYGRGSGGGGVLAVLPFASPRRLCGFGVAPVAGPSGFAVFLRYRDGIVGMHCAISPPRERRRRGACSLLLV